MFLAMRWESPGCEDFLQCRSPRNAVIPVLRSLLRETKFVRTLAKNSKVSPTSLPDEAVHEPPSFGGRLVQQPSLGVCGVTRFFFVRKEKTCPKCTRSPCDKNVFQARNSHTCSRAMRVKSAASSQHHGIMPGSRSNWAVNRSRWHCQLEPLSASRSSHASITSAVVPRTLANLSFGKRNAHDFNAQNH